MGYLQIGGWVVLEVCAWVLGAGSEQGYRRTLAASRQAEGQPEPLSFRPREAVEGWQALWGGG